MALRVEDRTCQLAGVFGCERGVCYWSLPPIRLLCRECHEMLVGPIDA